MGRGLWLLNAEGPGVAVSLWLLDAEEARLAVADFVFTGSFGFSWLPSVFTVKAQEGRVRVGAEGLELEWEALVVVSA